MLAFSSVGFSCEWIRVVKAHPWLAGLILALSLPADESRPIGFETASVSTLRRVKLGSGLCFTEIMPALSRREAFHAAKLVWREFCSGEICDLIFFSKIMRQNLNLRIPRSKFLT